ncbi:MAG: hypothetical protein QXX55_01265 [Candidatus Pacearchaeota archaeon]
MKTLAKILGTGLILTSLTGCNNKEYLSEEDFQNAKWIKFYNSNGRIYSCYMKEKIPKNMPNYHLYLDEVNRKNNGNLRGEILLPDLDGDGIVGK